MRELGVSGCQLAYVCLILLRSESVLFGITVLICEFEVRGVLLSWDSWGFRVRTCPDSSPAHAELDEQDEYLLDMEVDEIDSMASSHQPLEDLLAAVESETDVYKQVVLLTEKTLKAKETATEQQGGKKSNEQAVDRPVFKKKEPETPMPLTLLHIMEMACGDKAAVALKNDTDASCIARVKQLFPQMQAFVRMVREEEGFVSRKSLETSTDEIKNEHNLLQRRLAQARQEFDLNSSRRSRMQLWTTFSGTCVKAIAKGPEEEMGPVARVPQAFKPSCVMQPDKITRQYQVLCARSCTDDKLRLVLVQGVFRGAVIKKSKEGTRAMRATKPHYDVLPAGACSCVQGSILIPCSDAGVFYASNASPLLSFEVGGAEHQILYEVPSSNYTCKQEDWRLVLTFTPKARNILLLGHFPIFSLSHAKSC